MFKKLMCKHNYVIGKNPELKDGKLVTNTICIKCGKQLHDVSLHNNKILEKEKVSHYA